MKLRVALLALLILGCSQAAPATDAATDTSAEIATDIATDAPASDTLTSDVSPLDASTPDAAITDITDSAVDATTSDSVSLDIPVVDTATTDSASLDARADHADALTDTASETPATPVCTTANVADLLRDLRAARPAGVSAIAAPGARFEDLRARFDATPDAMTILTRARSTARRTVPTLAAGDSASYQTLSSLALAAALVAWHDRDATAARTALGALSNAAVAPSWFATATDVSILVGASLVNLAAAADLLTASTLTAAEIDTAKSHVGRAAASTEAWLQSGGLLIAVSHEDNHGMRLGAGLAAAAMIAPAGSLSDEVLAYALSHMSASIERQTGGVHGWAEGSTYFEYAFEVAAPALLAVDRAWTGADTRCASCPGHPLATCSTRPTTIVRPSRDPRVRDLIRWSASLETASGWLHPIDDSRLTGVPSPLFERLAGARHFSHWSVDGSLGSLGGQVNVGPLVALALALPELTTREPIIARWPAAGTARLDAMTPSGAPVEALFIAEHGVANGGAGHERPDTLALTVVVDGTLMLGASGYRDYDARAPLARADANSEITVEGALPRDLGASASGPDATLSADGAGTVGSFTSAGVTVTRSLAFEGGALVVRDRVELPAARAVAWHWHLRGSLDPASWTWTSGTRRCVATQTGESLPLSRETATDWDTFSVMGTHPVIRQSSTLSAGRHELVTRIACTSM